MAIKTEVDNSTLGVDDNQRQINQLYEVADRSGNWSEVADFELNLVLDVLARTPPAKKPKTP